MDSRVDPASRDGQAGARRQDVPVLVAIDDPDLATTCARFLKRLGHRPRVEHEAEAAAALIAGGWPELVLVDVQLPGEVDGLELVARARPPGTEGPVVLCTGLATEAARRRALAGGAAAYLAKPFSLDDLRAAVARALAPRAPGPPGGCA